MARFIVGTSGFSYPHWRGAFYPHDLPQSKWLEQYATVFSAVELNVTFYQLPDAETFKRWAADTPDDFSFSLKAPRTITHYHRFDGAQHLVHEFMSRARRLGVKLSCVLWQTPPTLVPDLARLDRFCEVLSRETPSGVRNVFEFRNAGWHDPAVYALLREHGFGVVSANPPFTAEAAVTTSHFAYVRFHGGQWAADSQYTRGELEPWAHTVRELLQHKMDVYAFFNNDEKAYAPRDAATLSDLVQHDLPGQPAARPSIVAVR